jgi:hypothetical protein
MGCAGVRWLGGKGHTLEVRRLSGFVTRRAAGCEAIDDDLLIWMDKYVIAESYFLVGWGNDGLDVLAPCDIGRPETVCITQGGSS